MELKKNQIKFFILAALFILLQRVIYRFVYVNFGMLGGVIHITAIVILVSIFYKIKTR